MTVGRRLPEVWQSVSSPALVMMLAVANGAGRHCASPRKSWQAAMRNALRLAIEKGMRFDGDDFRKLVSVFHPSKWFSREEWYYELAVRSGNTSACVSIELWKRREPFLDEKGKRMAVGSVTMWKGLKVACTSFVDGDAPCIRLCYQETSNGRLVSRKQFLVSYADWSREMRARRQAAKDGK